MHKFLFTAATTFLLTVLSFVANAPGQNTAPVPAVAGPPAPTAPTRVRELFVPFADLNVVLEADIQRVFLTRQEYEALLIKARQSTKVPPPQAAALLSAEYDTQIEDGRALIKGSIVLDVLDKGLQALTLDLSGVGIRKATIDGRPAPLVRDGQGKPLVLVQGLGRKTLLLELVAPLETSAAWQSLHVQLPRPAASKLRLVVPGNVEVKSGADVLQRTVDGPVTRFELLPRAGGEPLVMTLNNRQLLQQRVVMARSVVVDEVTQAYERLHASVSLSILRGAVEQFRFELPDGFEVNEVDTPLLARWIVVEPAAAKPDTKPDDAARKSRILEVSLREPTTEPVRVNITATRLAPKLESWTLPRFQPLDVASHVAVVGLLVDERLKFDSLVATRLIPIDAATITAALPASVFAADASAARVRPAAAFYAPQPNYALTARFTPPPSKLNVISNMLLLVEERQLLVRGGFELRPEVERLFHVDFTVPAGWLVAHVNGPDGALLPHEAFPIEGGGTRLRVALNPSVEPGSATRISFEAEATPEGWIGDWPKGRRDVTFPTCVVLGATRDEGALAVHAGSDLQVRPGDAEKFRGVTPLDANEKARFGLGSVASDLVYRYEGVDYALAFVAERGTPVISARTYSFLKIEAENLAAHYELVFSIERAAVQKLSFWLPASTPETIAIRGLDGAVVKEFSAAPLAPPADAESPKAKTTPPAWRRWTVQLADRARDKVRLAVDFQQRLPSGDLEKYALPLIRADEQQVTYQSGLVAVEGNAELDVAVTVDSEGPGRPKRIDVGELAQADYVAGRRVLGAFGFVGENPQVLADVFRRPAHTLPSALVQRAELITLLSRTGLTQTAARYQFRTKDLFLELQLPKGATLWSAYLDGQPLAPQRSGDSLLLSLTSAPANKLRDVQVVYEAPISAFSFRGKVTMPAPTLRLRTEAGGAGEDVFVADLQWQLVLPTGYRLTHSGGTVFPDLNDPVTQRQLALRHSPWVDLAAAPVVLAYGVQRSMRYGFAANLQVASRYDSAPSSRRFRNSADLALAPREGMADFDAIEMEMPMQESLELEGGMGGMGGTGMGPAGPGGGGGFGGGVGGAMLPPNAPMSSSRSTLAMPRAKSEPFTAKDVDASGVVVTLDNFGDKSAPKNDLAARIGGARGTGVDGRAASSRGSPTKPKYVFGLTHSDDDMTTTAPSEGRRSGSGDRGELAQVDRAKGVVDGISNTGLGSGGKGNFLWALEGVRSLPIEFGQYVQSGNAEVATFRSLGVAPQLEAALVNRQQLSAIALSAALLLGLFGIAMTNRTAGYKTRLVVVTLAIVTVLPLVGVWVNEISTVCDHVFWAAIALAAWYLLVGLGRKMAHPSRWPLVPRITKWWKHRFASRPDFTALASAAPASEDAGSPPPPPTAPSVSTATLLLIAIVSVSLLLAAPAFAQADDAPGAPQRKVTVPDDAIVVPYNPDDPQGIKKAERILVPLKKYQELWALANPGRGPAIAEAARLPAPFAWSGARYDATLAGTDDLTVTATLDLEIFTATTIDIPLPLLGGVITNAKLDGQPASLRLISPAVQPQPGNVPQQQAQAPNAPAQPPAPPVLVALTVRGPGRKQLTLTLGMQLQRRGGWRVAEGRVPVAPSTSLVLLVPDAKTEVRLGDVFDRARFDTTQPNERIETALGLDGIINLQWRPKVAEAEVDKSLTVTSKGDIELREDAVRVVWQLNLEFPRSRRETFSVYLPADYLLERVLGDNVRGWNVVVDEDVTLLKAVLDHESFALIASRRGRIGDGALADFPLPTIDVVGAALHQGTISLARSPWLDVRLDELRGLDRTDIPAVRTADALHVREESPLGVQPYQALKFATAGYAARLRVTSLAAPPNAELRSVWKIDPREMEWETQLVLRGGQRPTYQIRLRIPEALTLDQVTAANLHDWAITSGPKGRVLTIYLTIGVQGEFPVVLRGRLPAPPKDAPVAVPQVIALDVGAQNGYVVVQVDPSVDARTEELKGLESVLLNRTFGWLAAGQRPLARLALHFNSTDYSGMLRLVHREPRVTASSVTNVRVTGRSIEETMLIDFRIEEAGIRRVSFLLPAWMREARITAPLLREKKVTEAAPAGAAGTAQLARVRVQLDLQDEVMGSFRVLVENDRLLTAESQEAPIPVIETGRTEQRLIAIESSGRDEVAFDEPREIETISPQQQAWIRLTELFGKNILAAYQVKGDAQAPQLAYHTRDRQTVETVGARIGLAETQLEVDSQGAYRAKQTYQIDNGTEQFLVVAMPAGATLWTAVVAGEPVKPQQVPGGVTGQIRIPIVKTAPGDLDYSVELAYGGKLPPPGAWGQMRFPLMRTININVELSRVRLLLPPSHRWFQFGGTMGRVDERGQYEAGFLEYQTKQLSRLSELLQEKSKDDLQRLRVTNNLKQLGMALHSYQEGSGNDSGLLRNDEYARNLSTFNSVLEKTQQQVVSETAQQQVQLVEQKDGTDNRTRLNGYFLQQDANRASNVVGQIGGNFGQSESAGPVSGQQPAPPQPNAANPFNAKWFAANGLEQSVDAKRAKGRIMDPTLDKTKAGAEQPNQSKSGKEFFKKSNEELRDQLEELGKQQMPQKRGANKSQEESLETNRRYQQRLEQQGQGGGQRFGIPAQQNPNGVPQPDASNFARNAPGGAGQGVNPTANLPLVTPAREAAEAKPQDAQQGLPADRSEIQSQSDDFTLADFRSGMASLTVDLPGRGTEYLFTTPRGELEITAYAVETDLVGRLTRIGIVAAVLAALGACFRVYRRFAK